MNNITNTNLNASRVLHRDYDSYLFAKKGTTAYLEIEKEIILNELNPLKMRNLAIDLGCGTGRVTRLLIPEFTEVVGFDICNEMLTLAKDRCFSATLINHDINLGFGHYVNGKADFICGSFGVGSCIANLEKFLSETFETLNNNGKLILSFYNHNYDAPLDSADLSFSGILQAHENKVVVNHFESNLQININTYTQNQLEKLIEKYQFSERTFYFLPTVAGLIKNDLLKDETFFNKIIEIDKSLARYPKTHSAPYIILVLKK